ncbi:hypothetical protein LOK49_LG09G01460 [Camellia lanceoleosa]|uniref:Uncharacterized protein n=1 Tax=Camellia lanceoleosa TaxID=1840588 RepID=A0ACC0GLV0_9ERIC|nr:hypothetical protein LOK49_LG09G01460 [Camellia lanceoleosa]
MTRATATLSIRSVLSRAPQTVAALCLLNWPFVACFSHLLVAIFFLLLVVLYKISGKLVLGFGVIWWSAITAFDTYSLPELGFLSCLSCMPLWGLVSPLQPSPETMVFSSSPPTKEDTVHLNPYCLNSQVKQSYWWWLAVEQQEFMEQLGLKALYQSKCGCY